MKAIRRCLRRARRLLDRERTQLARINILVRANGCDPSCTAAIKNALIHNAEAKLHLNTIARLLQLTAHHRKD